MTSFSLKMDELKKKSCLIASGPPARYLLTPVTDNLNQPDQPFKKFTFGERNTQRKHKTILMVGETGTGKTTLINTMINYILDVQREDMVWFQMMVTAEERSVKSQTSDFTIYELYLQEASVDLTIIDTPGFGDTRDIKRDQNTADNLLHLSRADDGLHEIDAVCLVINSCEIRLSDRQTYIYDAIQSLFGKDVAENIVLLLTHSNGRPPRNVLMAVEEAKVKCAVDEKNQPVYFLFENSQADPFDEECKEEQEHSWNLSFKGMKEFFSFLDVIKPKSLQMTQDVLKQRKQLEANISNLQLRVQEMELKQHELKQTQKALEEHEKDVKDNKNFTIEVDVTYKEKVPIDSAFWHLTKQATCCSECQENCHYPGCWWVKDLSWCSVMKDDHCTVCTNKCHYTKHTKENKIYVTKTKKEKRTYEDLKKKYEKRIGDSESVINKLEEELQELQREKLKLVFEAFHCVETLELIALNRDSLITLQHIDFMIEKMKEMNEPQKAETLKNIKKRSGETNPGALEYVAHVARRMYHQLKNT